MDTIYDVIILGSGPAGLTAAIYTSRAELKTLVVGGNPPGGQLTLTTDVENYPGFPEGIMGPELIQKMRDQAIRFGVDIVDENAQNLTELAEGNFTVTLDNSHTYQGRTVIIATGATAKWLNLDSEQRLRGKGVSACATCDGFFFKEKVVAVVGGGDSAMEEANFLTKFASKVYVLVRGSQENMKASKIMLRRSQNNPKIEFIFNVEVKEVLGDQSVTGLKLLNNQTNEESELEVQGMFLAIGHKPNTDFVKDLVSVDTLGYAETKTNSMSNVKGIFIAGDVHDHRYRQAITAAGYGCMAAIDVERYLANEANAQIA